jgi:4-amino-4-deoxy-L-arabinose transferase-like glycosyltransferase
MLLAFLGVLLLLLTEKSLFIDDSMHMPAGYSYLLTHDYRLNQEHPPLIKLLSGLGLWKLRPAFPLDSPGWQQAATPGDPEDGMVRIEEQFFDINAKQFEQIAFYGRLPVVIVPLVLLFAVWWFTRQLFGPIPALIATFLLGTEPNIIGNSIVVQDDVAAALALLLFVIALRKFLVGARTRDAVVLGGALGIALTTKYSLLILVPLTFLILVVHAARQVIRKRSSPTSVVLSSCLVFILAYVILIGLYAFHVDTIDANESSIIASWFYLSGNTAELLHKFFMWLPPMLPRYFVYGIDLVVHDIREGRPAFLLGEVSDNGWWYYFPVAFALKTTTPFLINSVCGIVWSLVNIPFRKRYVLLYVALPTIFYLILSMTSHLNIGVRHLLPVFPFVAIAGAGVISAAVELGLRRGTRHKVQSTRLAGITAAIVMIVILPALLIAISTFPNYLTYFSPLAGGTERGWKMLSDSNVETGQEVKTLARYLKDRGENRVAGIMVGGEFLKFYGVQLDDFPGWYNVEAETEDESAESRKEPEDGNVGRGTNPALNLPVVTTGGSTDANSRYVAIGAWYFSEIGLSDKQKQIIDTYKNQRPEAMVGNSIFVFRRH